MAHLAKEGKVFSDILEFIILVKGSAITLAESFKIIGGIPSIPIDFLVFNVFKISSTSGIVTDLNLKDEILRELFFMLNILGWCWKFCIISLIITFIGVKEGSVSASD